MCNDQTCNHDFKPCAYNSSIVIEECTKCGEEVEHDFDEYCLNNGFPDIDFENEE